MKQLTIVSGKGGTGKTSITAALGQVLREHVSLVMVDADVDAANLALVNSGGNVLERDDFYSGLTAYIDRDLCVDCGACMPACPFDAIYEDDMGRFMVNELACEGCKVCTLFCGVDAIEIEENHAGSWRMRRLPDGRYLVDAQLGIGEDNSGKLVAKIREKAGELAEKENLDLILIDGPPGIGCPVHAAIGRVDLVMVVTEPTVSAVHDLRRVIETIRHFGLKPAVVLNKADLSPEAAQEVRDFCAGSDVPLVAEIPYDETIPRLLTEGHNPLEHPPFKEKVLQIAAFIRKELFGA